MRVLPLIPWLALVACGPQKDSNVTVDEDGDGVSAETDCNDADAAIFPGAVEACNGLDDDCDGDSDESDAADAPTWARDADGDGAIDPNDTLTACAAEEGYLDASSGTLPTDCDDTNAAVRPGAVEICDGLDNDCDPATLEAGLATLTTAAGSADVSAELRGTAEEPAVYTLSEGTLAVCAGTWFARLEVSGEAELRGYGSVALDAAGSGTVVRVAGAGAHLEASGVTIRGGAGDSFAASLGEGAVGGGGLSCTERASVALTDVVLRQNDGLLGGGILTDDCAELTLEGVSLEENTAMFGGAYAGLGTPSTWTSSTVQLNVAESGGGALLSGGATLDLVGTRFRANEASSAADAMYLDAGTEARCASDGASRAGFTRHPNPNAVELFAETSVFTAEDCDFGADDSADDNAVADLGYWERPVYRVGDAASFRCENGRCGEPTASEAGAADLTTTWPVSAAFGNAFLADSWSTLEGFELHIDIPATCEVDAAVVKNDLYKSGSWELEWVAGNIDFRGGTGWVESGPVGVLLEPGVHYAALIGYRCVGTAATLSYSEAIGGETGAGTTAGIIFQLSGYTAPWAADPVLTISPGTLHERVHVTRL